MVIIETPVRLAMPVRLAAAVLDGRVDDDGLQERAVGKELAGHVGDALGLLLRKGDAAG
jgi:hypothetical protein